MPFWGCFRAVNSVKAYSRVFRTYIITWRRSVVDQISELKHLTHSGAKLVGLFDIHKVAVYVPRQLGSIFMRVKWLTKPQKLKPDIVMSWHENPEFLMFLRELSGAFSSRSVAVIQNPPFLSSRERVRSIASAWYSWIEEVLYPTSRVKRLAAYARWQARFHAGAAKARTLLREFDLVIVISRPTLQELGGGGSIRAVAMDPGVGLDEYTKRLLIKASAIPKTRSNLVVFGGAPTPEKGVHEALKAFKLMVKVRPSLKMVITGELKGSIREKLFNYAKRLGVVDKVVFAGFVSRYERFKLVRSARVMIYPSHFDAYSYSVLESLFLSTPVVAYDIPAIRYYHGSNPGVKLVREGDIEGMAVSALELLDKREATVEPPPVRSMHSVLMEEISLISKFLR
jgi:glycosyltransferase involved in cell wall biosynthesis